MCGIAGIVGGDEGEERVARMTAALAHRGPDDYGTWHEPGVALGHRRLSIIDLSPAGHQPMIDGDCVVTYNGEIYNYRELRASLGGEWRSDSDTEVLLRLYREHGDRCVSMLEGMFAFAIWDRRRQRLFAARDPLGIKPLHYRLDGDSLAFASELKALTAVWSDAVDPTAIHDFLAYGYIPAPKTVYARVAKLPAAHTLVWEKGAIRLERYWNPSASIRVTEPDAARRELDRLLGRVVQDQLVSDVPVGVFLSGGIDSATVSYYAKTVRTFTLGFDRAKRSEADAARALAAHFGLEHVEATAGRVDLAEALETVPRIYDEPFGDSGAWSGYLVAKLARPHVTVALSGEGGDELFCGYPRYWQERAGRGSPLARKFALLAPPLSRSAFSLARHALNSPEDCLALLGNLGSRQLGALLSREYLPDGYDSSWFYRQYWREDLDPVQRMRWLDLHTNLPEGLLVKVDRASMAHSLEVRPPLLDRRLIEFSLGLHPELLVDPAAGRGKLLLRALMAPRVPPGHLDQPKSGFGLPVRSWARHSPGIVHAAVARLRAAGILKRAVSPGFRRIWPLLVLDRWVARH
jgi:asparagine synthase (glutamine-hydrolysing)